MMRKCLFFQRLRNQVALSTCFVTALCAFRSGSRPLRAARENTCICTVSVALRTRSGAKTTLLPASHGVMSAEIAAGDFSQIN
jgi:hypothetical protein